MKLEYLHEGSDHCPLIRLFDFTRGEAAQFALVTADLAARRIQRMALHELSFIRSVGRCQLTLCIDARDAGVKRISQTDFECRLTVDGWDEVTDFVGPFVAGSSGYQWLVEHPGDAALLFSQSGQW
jgi:hypothetical protein